MEGHKGTELLTGDNHQNPSNSTSPWISLITDGDTKYTEKCQKVLLCSLIQQADGPISHEKTLYSFASACKYKTKDKTLHFSSLIFSELHGPE